MVLPIEYNNKRTDLRKYRYNWKAPYSHPSHSSHPSHPRHSSHPSHPSHSSQPSHPTHPRHPSHPCHPSLHSHPSGFFLVVLSGSKAALPDVGSCTFMEYYCAARKCNTDFIKGLQRDPNGSCRYGIKVVSERMSQLRFFFRCLVQWLSQIRSFPTITH